MNKNVEKIAWLFVPKLLTFAYIVLLYDKKDDAVEGNPGNGERSYRRLHGETELPQVSL